MGRKLKLALIADAAKRRATFKRRKRGFLNKLDQFTTLCGVKAGAVIYDDQGVGPVVWPTPEGFQEVVSTFMALPESERFKNMMDHASYLEDRIRKGEERVRLLRYENRETMLNQFMFDWVEGKKKVNECEIKDLGDLSVHIDKYMHQINTRIEHHTNVGEASSSSSLPPAFLASFTGGQGPDHLAFQEPYNPGVMDTTMVTGPTQFYDNMNQHESVPTGFTDLFRSQHMYLNQQEPVEHHVPPGLTDMNLSQHPGPSGFTDMNLNGNVQQPLQHHITPINFNGQTQHGTNGTNSTQDIDLDINQQGSFMSLLMQYAQQMGNMNLNNQELVQHHGPSSFTDMNLNLQQPLQHHIPASSFNDLTHFQNINQNQEESVQHHTPINFNGQTQHGIYDTNSTEDVDLDINQQGSFMSLLMQNPQQMGYIGEHGAHMPFMNEDNHCEPPPTADHDLPATPYMPSSTMADVFCSRH